MNTEKTEITALPWKAVNDSYPRRGFPVILSGHMTVVKTDCSVGGRNWVESPEQAEANAHFIVRAANAHHELVRALEYLLETFRSVKNSAWFDLQVHPRKDIYSSIEMIESALRLAREQKGKE